MESYATVEYAGQYFSGRLHTEKWTEATQPEKEAALQTATRIIDRQILKGKKADTEQVLAFPRYPDETVPDIVMQACCEEALALLERGNSKRRKLQAEGVQSFSAGNISEVFAPGAGRGLLSTEARELLRAYLAGSVFID